MQSANGVRRRLLVDGDKTTTPYTSLASGRAMAHGPWANELLATQGSTFRRCFRDISEAGMRVDNRDRRRRERATLVKVGPLEDRRSAHAAHAHAHTHWTATPAPNLPWLLAGKLARLGSHHPGRPLTRACTFNQRPVRRLGKLAGSHPIRKKLFLTFLRSWGR